MRRSSSRARSPPRRARDCPTRVSRPCLAPPPKNTTPRWPYRGRNGADDAAQEHHSVEVPGPLSSGDGCSDDATLLEPAEQTGAVAQLGGPAGTVSTSGITSA